jgi:hypothetical protein
VHDRRLANAGQIDARPGALDAADHTIVVELVISCGVGRRCKGDALDHAAVAQRQPHEHASDPSTIEQLPPHHGRLAWDCNEALAPAEARP